MGEGNIVDVDNPVGPSGSGEGVWGKGVHFYLFYSHSTNEKPNVEWRKKDKTRKTKESPLMFGTELRSHPH